MGRDALGGLAAVWLIWGYNWTLMKVAAPYIGPWEFVFLRSAGAMVILLALMLVWRRSLAPRPLIPLLLIGLFQGSGMNGLSMAAVWFGSASKATILVFLMPFWTVLFARLFLHEPVRRSQWTAVALGGFGVFLILAPHHGTLVAALGDLFAIGAGMSWALGTIVAKWAGARHKLDAWSIVTWQTIFGTVPLGIASWLIPEPRIVWSVPLVVTLAYATILAGIVAWVIWLRLLERVSASTAGMGALAIPVIGIVSAYLQLGERPQPIQWLGILAVLAALAIVTTANELRSRRSLVTLSVGERSAS